MPEIGLNGTGVFALAGKLITLAVTEHMRVDRKGQTGLLAGPLNNRVYRPGRKGRLTLGDKDKIGIRIVTLELPESSDLVALEVMDGRVACLEPVDMEATTV